MAAAFPTMYLCHRCLGRLRGLLGVSLSSLGGIRVYTRTVAVDLNSIPPLHCKSLFPTQSPSTHLTRTHSLSYSNLSDHDEGSDTIKDAGGCKVQPPSAKAYWQNTFVTASRAMTDYLLDLEDLEDLTKRTLRSADEDSKSIECYLKTDIEKRALEVWGSWQVLEHELKRRRRLAEEEERRRKGLGSLIAQLKKYNKTQVRKKIDKEMFGDRAERVSFLRGSAKVVFYAIVSNFAVFVFKLMATLYTGSAAMLSEAIHSLADMLNQCLLAFGIAQSIRTPDPNHPYGWSRARYVYSLISGVGIFFLGAGVTSYHGIMGLLHPHALENIPVALSVLGASAVVEGWTLWAAIKQVQKSAKETGVSFKDYVLRGRDPTAVAVLMEDSAAVGGVFIAASALGMVHMTGNAVYDAIGSVSIGGLLGVVALFLIQRNSSALVGRSIPPDRLKQITDLLESDIMIRSIHDVKATDMGADTVRFKAEVNFDGREVAKARIDRLNLESLLVVWLSNLVIPTLKSDPTLALIYTCNPRVWSTLGVGTKERSPLSRVHYTSPSEIEIMICMHQLCMQDIQKISTVEELERFLLEHGEQVVDTLGSEVDRIEQKIKKQSPEVRHVDLEIL